jgi:methionyl-tRNA formyltransferase
MTSCAPLDLSGLRILVAGYGLPAEYGLATLFAHGCQPQNLRLLTHEADERNSGLVAAARLRAIDTRTGSAKDEAVIVWVEDFSPDVILSLHYRALIPARILKAARRCAINLHPSLLPKYRGTNSVAWVIINGEAETGFSYHHMGEAFDTGHVIVQERLAITPTDTAFSLFHRQITAAMSHLETAITRAVVGDPGQPQVGEPSYFARALPHGGVIDDSWSQERIERFIRAMYFPPFAPAKARRGDELVPVDSLDDYLRLAPPSTDHGA